MIQVVSGAGRRIGEELEAAMLLLHTHTFLFQNMAVVSLENVTERLKRRERRRLFLSHTQFRPQRSLGMVTLIALLGLLSLPGPVSFHVAASYSYGNNNYRSSSSSYNGNYNKNYNNGYSSNYNSNSYNKYYQTQAPTYAAATTDDGKSGDDYYTDDVTDDAETAAATDDATNATDDYYTNQYKQTTNDNYSKEKKNYQNADDDKFHWNSNVGFDGVSFMPVSCIN
jgi:hypothetical protein